MAYGIDKEVSDLSKVYANNPKALQQQYQKSGDILNLIALLRVKDDLDRKKDEIALQMQGDPKTVAEQTAEETKGLMQKDVTDQTSKLLTQKKGREDARLRKLAAGQRPNAPLGIPAAAQRRGVPNQQMMAGIGNIPPRSPVNPRGKGIAANRLQNTNLAAKGGIVSFANQGWVNPRTGKQFSDAALKMLGVTSPEWARMDDAERGALIQQFNEHQWAAQEGASRSELLEKEISTDDPLATEEAIPGSATGGPKDRIPLLQNFENIMSTDEFAGVTGSGRDPLPEKVVPPRSVAAVVPDDAAPPPAPEAVDPLATINRSILDPLTNVGLPTSTVEYKDPFKTEKGEQIVEDQETLQDWQAGERARDPVAERAATTAWADLQTGKQGIADLNARQVAARRALQEEQAGQRQQNQFADLMAFGGGRGPLADMSRGAYGMRQANYDRIERELMGIQGLQQYGQEQTTAAGKVAIEAGTEQMKMTEAARTEAGRSETQLLEQMGDQLSETAKQYLEAGKANQTEQGALRNDKVLLAIKNVDAAVKLSIADREYVISKEANDLRKLAITSQDMRTLMTGKVDVAQKLGDLGAKYQKMAADALTYNYPYQAMEAGPEKDKIQAANQLFFHDAENIARAELEATGAMIQDKLQPMIAALPPENSASKFTNVKQTSP